MRLLVINPNASRAITRNLDAYLRRALGSGGPELTCVTAPFGPLYITSRAGAAIAAHAALDAYARCADDAHDAVLLACFGDPGLAALREVSPIPVVGLAEASCLAAAENGRRFSIVTGGVHWGPMLEELVAGLGLTAQLASVRTLDPSGLALLADPDGASALLSTACQRCVGEDGAEAVVVGGASLAGWASWVATSPLVPTICSVEAGLLAAVGAIQRPPRPVPSSDSSGVVTRGLSPALARLLARASGDPEHL